MSSFRIDSLLELQNHEENSEKIKPGSQDNRIVPEMMLWKPAHLLNNPRFPFDVNDFPYVFRNTDCSLNSPENIPFYYKPSITRTSNSPRLNLDTKDFPYVVRNRESSCQSSENIPVYYQTPITSNNAPPSSSLNDPGFVFHKISKPKRNRTTFSKEQMERLENTFKEKQYVVGRERKELAKELNLSETQIKIWFQNRRTKSRRHINVQENSDQSTNLYNEELV